MKKIIVIKLGAKGDVIRTLSILPALKKKFPNSEITWITKNESVSIISGNQFIDKIHSTPFFTEEKFDFLYNFDLDDEAMHLAKNTNAFKKYGFYLDQGFPTAFNNGALYYLNTFFDDDLKKNNRRNYQEMIFEIADIPYNREHCPIYLNEQDIIFANNFLKENRIDEEEKSKLIGFHIGSSERWPSRSWPTEKIKDFIKESKKYGYEIVLFGGPNETEKHKKIISDLNEEGIGIFYNKTDNNDREFISLINLCEKIICSDSFALHVSLALKKPTITLFFCTSPHEIEGYGLLKKIISPMLEKIFPEKMDQYSEELINSISISEVLEALKDGKKVANQMIQNPVQINKENFLIRSKIGKVKSIVELENIISHFKENQKKIVFTNGCYDIIHLGHIALLEKAKSLGDILIVGLNTDDSIKRIKGKLRPVFSENERLQILSSLECVDYVTLFNENTPSEIIEVLKPDIHVKGGDYDSNDFNSMPEAKIINDYGGKIIIIPLLEGYSSTDIIDKILKMNN